MSQLKSSQYVLPQPVSGYPYIWDLVHRETGSLARTLWQADFFFFQAREQALSLPQFCGFKAIVTS